MNIKISNAELLNALVPGLQELAGIRTNGKIAYNVAKTLKSCDIAVTAFNEQKKIVLESACEKDENGKAKIEKSEYVFSTPEVKEATIQAINDLIKTEIELDVYPIDIADFQALEGISAGTILRLGQFVVEDLKVVK